MAQSGSGIAVIIPYYNGSAYIRRALESLSWQRLPADEVVIVNDGSTEDESRFVDDLCKELGVRLVHQKNGGQGSARNAGVAATTSPYLCFLDQDDFYLPDHNDVLRAAVPSDETNFGWVYADIIKHAEPGLNEQAGGVEDYAVHPKADLRQVLAEDMYILPAIALISRRAFDAVGGFDAQFRGCEDDDLFVRLFHAGFTNRFIPHPVAVWNLNQSSTVYSFWLSRSRMRYFLKLADDFPDDVAAGEFYMRDCLAPRFGETILKDARRAQKPSHKFYQYRDEAYEMTLRCVDRMLGNSTVTGELRRKLWWQWQKVRYYRYGLFGMLTGRKG